MTTYLYNGSYYSTTITKIALGWIETCCINSIWTRVPFDLTYPWVCIKRTPFVIFNKQMLYYEYPLDTFFRFNGQMMCTFYIKIDVFVLELSVHSVYQHTFVVKDLISNMRHDMRWMKSLLVSTVLMCIYFVKMSKISAKRRF